MADFHGCNRAKTLHVVSEIRKHSVQCRGTAVRAHSSIINSIIPEQKRMEIPRRQYVKFRSKIWGNIWTVVKKDLTQCLYNRKQFIQLNKNLKAALQGSQWFGDAVNSRQLLLVAAHLRLGRKYNFHSQLFLFFRGHKHALLLKVKSSA